MSSPSPSRLRRRGLLSALALLGLTGAAAWRLQRTPDVPPPPDDWCIVAPPTPYDPALGQPVTAARAVPADARCPVCGMYPARAPDWAAQVIFDNGDAQFFDSPLSLLRYLADVGHYSRGRDASQIMARYVTDTGTREWVALESAFLVHGSAALGPMRAGNLPGFATRSAAQAFAAQRGGKVLVAAQVDAPLLAGIDGGARHQHGGR